MRKLATAAWSTAAAILLSRYLLPYGWLLPCCAVAAALSTAGLLFHGNKRIRIFIALISLSTGFLWSWAYTALFVSPTWDYHGQTTSVSAVVTDYPSAMATRGYRVDAVIRRDGSPDVGARLYYYDEINLEPGDIIEFTALFRRTDGVVNGSGSKNIRTTGANPSTGSGPTTTPEDDNRIDALSARGAFLSAYISGSIEHLGTTGPLRFFPKKLAESLARKIDEIFPHNVSPFMQALLTGKRDELKRDSGLGAALSGSGIAHIVSISGMHISFLMGFLAIIVKNKRLFAITGIPILLLFMAMTGFTPSVTRAGLMQIFLICAPIFRRESDSITSLSAALLALLLLNPYSCASVGLQLSFSATLGIILFTPGLSSAAKDSFRDKKYYKKKIPRLLINFIVSSLATTAGALIFTLPLTALHFGYVSLIAPLTNLLTLFAVSLAFPLGLIAALLGFISTQLGTIAAYPVALIAEYILFAARTLAAVPYSSVYASNALIMFWLAYIYIIFITLPLLRARPRQYICPACISVILLFILLLLSPLLPGSQDTSISVLDVGQGLSVVISSEGRSAVVDCGSASGEDAGAITHGFLISQGKVSLDLLILTHFHADHVNGVLFLLSRTKVSAIAIPDPEDSWLADEIIELARRRGTDIIYITEIYRVSLGSMELIVYPPLDSGSENESGLSVLAYGEINALITGDMSSSGERSLLRYTKLPELDLLVVGHHGSKHSTSEELLGALKPEFAVIPVGRNSYGHPAGQTLDRLVEYSVTVFQTDILGHITVNAGE